MSMSCVFFATCEHYVVGTIPDKTPFELDTEIEVEDPFDFQAWINTNRDVINQKGRLAVFDCDKYQFRVRK